MKPLILIIHGPNLNMLGVRDVVHYGSVTLGEIEAMMRKEARALGVRLEFFQSNHEGALIDFLQKRARGSAGVVINPGALTHYSYALHDALLDAGIPAVEVHLSDVKNREKWRRISVTAPACVKVISGKKERGYIEALRVLIGTFADVRTDAPVGRNISSKRKS